MVKQQPSMANDDQPNIAVICVNYYEKLAVDAMMTNKVTFVRHKPEGKLFRFFVLRLKKKQTRNNQNLTLFCIVIFNSFKKRINR